MAKPKLRSLTIYPGERGHRVVQEFHSKPVLRKGALSGGLAMDGAAPQEHNFGPGDSSGLMKHITAALALKSLADSGRSGGAGEEED